MESIDALAKKLSSYLEPSELKQVKEAFMFASEAHTGQFRSSGDPYVSHPLAVANILSNFKMDQDSISAAILHDVMEDSGTPKHVIQNKFNKNVALLVDGVSKLNKLQTSSRKEAQAENLQKMILAMAKDIRVIIVKLADRLHNMRTIHFLDRDKQIRIAKETLEIYAPIAHRIGMNNVYRELEDIAFQTIYPTRALRLGRTIKKNIGGKRKLIAKMLRAIEKRLLDFEIPAYVEGREKHLYSIYRKMKERKRSFEEIMDAYAVKIIVDDTSNCYKALGAIHSLYKPVEGRFKDYIAIPKSNGYQSVHTGVFGLSGQPIEVQIKTKEMDELAQNGIASHWSYKSGDDSSSIPQNKARRWVTELLEMRESTNDSEEFVDSIKSDLFPDEIYVFTPEGDVIEMPNGSTPIDFAFAVHTDIGHHCQSCRINRKLAPLSVPLESGQTIEIIRDSMPKTNPSWLNFAHTARARTSIIHYLKTLKNSEAKKFGKKLLEQTLNTLDINLKDINKLDLRAALDHIGISSLNRLLEEIGSGERTANIVAHQMAGRLGKPHYVKKKSIPLEITGSEGLVVNYGTCCKPIPGDSVIGHFTTERGMVVHQERCKNILSIREDPTQCFPVNWKPELTKGFSSEIKVMANDQPALLATLASSIASTNTNIESINSQDFSTGNIDFYLTLEVIDRIHLSKVMRKIRSLKAVNSVTRVHSQEMRQTKIFH